MIYNRSSTVTGGRTVVRHGRSAPWFSTVRSCSHSSWTRRLATVCQTHTMHTAILLFRIAFRPKTLIFLLLSEPGRDQFDNPPVRSSILLKFLVSLLWKIVLTFRWPFICFPFGALCWPPTMWKQNPHSKGIQSCICGLTSCDGSWWSWWCASYRGSRSAERFCMDTAAIYFNTFHTFLKVSKFWKCWSAHTHIENGLGCLIFARLSATVRLTSRHNWKGGN